MTPTEIYVVTRHRIKPEPCRCDLESCLCVGEVRFFDDVIACFFSYDEAEKAAAGWRAVGELRYDEDAWFDYEVSGPIPIGRTAVLA